MVMTALASALEATYYDLEFRYSQHSRDEIAFYVGCGRQMPGPILELGCRTGRISLPLARSGRSVWAVDNDPTLLDRANRERNRLPDSSRYHLHLFHNDLASFDFGQRFELIILPYRVFNAMTDPEMRVRCLTNIRRHLGLGGTLILDLYNFPAYSAAWYHENQLSWEGIDPLTGVHVRKSSTLMHIEDEGRYLVHQFSYLATFPDGRQEQLDRVVPQVCIRAHEMRCALWEAGFNIFVEMGYFDGRALGNGPELIFVCN